MSDLNYDELIPNLYVGGTNGMPPDLNEIRAAGFDCVFVCRSELDERTIPPIPDGLRVYYACLFDSLLTAGQLELAVDAASNLAECVERGAKCLALCGQGLNRSSFVAGLALHCLTDLSGPDIVRLIRLNRKSPPAYPHLQPLFNESFAETLRNLKRSP